MSKFKIQTLSEKLRARKRTRATLIVVLVLLLPFLIAGSWFWLQINPITGAGEKVEFVIERGSGTSAIGEILEKMVSSILEPHLLITPSWHDEDLIKLELTN